MRPLCDVDVCNFAYHCKRGAPTNYGTRLETGLVNRVAAMSSWLADSFMCCQRVLPFRAGGNGQQLHKMCIYLNERFTYGAYEEENCLHSRCAFPLWFFFGVVEVFREKCELFSSHHRCCRRFQVASNLKLFCPHGISFCFSGKDTVWPLTEDWRQRNASFVGTKKM